MNEWLIGSVCVALTLVGVFYPLKRYVKIIVCGVPLLIALIIGAYALWGAGPQWKAYQERERARAMFTSAGGISTLQDQIKTRLQKHPQDARGWFLLGRLYVAQNQWKPAHAAFKKAYHLTPTDAPVVLNYAQSFAILHHGSLNKSLRTLLKRSSTHHLQPDALMLLAMDAYQHHAYEQAITYWQDVLRLLPARSAEARAVQEALAQARAHIYARSITSSVPPKRVSKF